MSRTFILICFLCSFGCLLGQDTTEEDQPQATTQTTGVTTLPGECTTTILISTRFLSDVWFNEFFRLQVNSPFPMACWGQSAPLAFWLLASLESRPFCLLYFRCSVSGLAWCLEIAITTSTQLDTTPSAPIPSTISLGKFFFFFQIYKKNNESFFKANPS